MSTPEATAAAEATHNPIEIDVRKVNSYQFVPH